MFSHFKCNEKMIINKQENVLQNSHDYTKLQQKELKRKTYNDRQTLLIPFIVDIDFRLLFDLSNEQYNLLTKISTLLD